MVWLIIAIAAIIVVGSVLAAGDVWKGRWGR